MKRAIAALLLSLTACLTGGAARGCGAAEAACVVPLGQYRVAAPAMGSAPRPAVVFLHGFGGSGVAILRQTALVSAFTDHGMVVIAPDGLVRPSPGNTSPGSTSWSFRPNEPHSRDELAFVRDVLADAVGRWRIDRVRVLLAGESLGGSLTWYLACRAPGEFAAYAPVAGGFWNPLPEGCAGPVKLLHTHGWRDEVVPLEGRIIRDVAVQGDIFAGLALWRRANGCATQAPAQIEIAANAGRRRWTGCAGASWLELVLHDGGHVVPDWWGPMARAWFEQMVPR